jgi:hypothetical protein
MNLLTGWHKIELSSEEQNCGKEGISGTRAIYWFPLKMPFDIEKPGYTESVQYDITEQLRMQRKYIPFIYKQL